MNTLQEQYNLIKEGKGAKDVFLKHAKALFPEYIPNSMGFDNTVVILKQRSILKENSSYKEIVKEKDNFELDFKKFLSESKKEEKSIKADLKKTDKSVDKTNDEANYDNTDTKSADNVIFDQYMRGIYVEMSKDSKQDLDTVKKKVLKNLTKDPIYYVKNGQFGVEGVGYSDELPGAKTAKDDKTIVIDKSKPKANVKDTLSKKEAAKGAPKKVKEMSTTAKNSKGVKKMAPPTKGKIIKLKENQTLADLFENTNQTDVPEGWSESKISDQDQDKELYGGKIVKMYTAPMDGWDEEHEDILYIIEKEDGSFKISAYYAFGGDDEELEKELFNSLEAAQKRVVEVMEEIMENWDEEGNEGEEDLDEGNGLNERITNMINKVMEGGMEDADAQLAKQEADAEAKAAAVSKQRADNKAKMAAANKNI